MAYLFLFRLEQLGVKEVMKYVKHQNLRKMYLVGLLFCVAFQLNILYLYIILLIFFLFSDSDMFWFDLWIYL